MIEKKTVTITIRELFFYLFFAIMFGMRMWGIYEGKVIYAPLLVVGFVFWGISMLMNEHTIFEYIIFALLMIIAGVVYHNTGEKGLLMYFALMLGMKGIDEKRLFKVGLIAGMSGMITLNFLSAFGVIRDVAYIQEQSHLGGVFRRSLGYPHPNTLSTSFAIMTMMFMFVIGNKNKARVWKASAIMFIYALYLYLYSGSRTGLVITSGYLAVNLFYGYRRRLITLEKILVMLVLPFLWVISIVAPLLLSDELLIFLVKKDPTFAARWTMGKYYFAHNKVTLFGCVLNNPDKDAYGIDMSQLYLFLQLGVVAFCIVSLLWIILLIDEINNQRIEEIVITVSLLLMGITDPFLYNIGFKNLAFVFMGRCIFEVLEKNQERIPGLLKCKIGNIKICERSINISVPSTNYLNQGCGNTKSFKRVAIVACIVVFWTVMSVSVYCLTPEPRLVLNNRGPGEHEVDDDIIVGKLFTEDEIADLKASGNIVLNYSVKDPLMYVYYIDEADYTEGAYLAPMAGKVEKLRRYISLFFWGALFSIYLMKMLCQYVMRGNQT